MAKALVEYDYSAQYNDELTLKKGDIITNIEIKSGGWWEGTLAGTGKRGMFPDNFVKLLRPSEVSQESGDRKCKVLFNYKPSNDDELELQIGDIINILGEEEEGWWRGELNNHIGVFPSNFVEIMDTPPKYAGRQHKISKEENVKISGSNPPLSDKTEVKKSNALKREGSHKALELILNQDGDKVDVKLQHEGNEVGNTSIESKHSKEKTLDNIPAGGKDADSEAPSLPPKPSKEMCRVIFPYEAANDDELTLETDDVITIITKEGQDVGWWKGELKGKIGVFPDNFVKIIPPEEMPKPERPSKSPIKSPFRHPEPAPTKPVVNKTKKPVDKSPPSFLTVKPTVPIKPPKTTPFEEVSSSVSTTTVKNYETITTSSSSRISTTTLNETAKKEIIDKVDGGSWSRHSVSSGSSQSINLISSIKNEVDLDSVERAAMLTHPTQTRPRAPKRRPPSSAVKDSDFQEKKEEEMVNGNVDIEKPTSKSSLIEELRMSQAKKMAQISRTSRVVIGPSSEVVDTSQVSEVTAISTSSNKSNWTQVSGVKVESPVSSKPPPAPVSLPPEEDKPVTAEEGTIVVSAKDFADIQERVKKAEKQVALLPSLIARLDQQDEIIRVLQKEIDRLKKVTTTF